MAFDIIRQFLNLDQSQAQGQFIYPDPYNPPQQGQSPPMPMVGGGAGGTQPQARTAPQGGGASYMDQYNQMLAPYQAAAQKFSSPYAVFPPQSQFTAQHPLLSRAIDRGVLTASMIPGGPGPRSAGENIASVAQGLTGANQFYRERALQAMMLPYQMMGPRLQQADTIAQMQERQAMIPYYTERAKYFNTMGDTQQQRADTAAQGADIRQQAQDLKEAHQNWLEGNDPKSPFSGRSGDQTWKNVLASNPRYEGEVDETYAKRLDDIYQSKRITIAGALSGAGAGARGTAEKPFVAEKQDYDAAISNFKSTLQKPMTREAFNKQYSIIPTSVMTKEQQTEFESQYQKHVTDTETSNTRKTQEFTDKWRADHSKPASSKTPAPRTPQGGQKPVGW